MKRILKKPANFFALLIEQAEHLEKITLKLKDYCLTHDESIADQAILIEDEADMTRRVIIDEMNRTFITPIDREDLFNLSRQLDEIIDYHKVTVIEIRLFEIKPDADMLQLVQMQCDMAIHIKKAIVSIEKHKDIAKDEAFYVKHLENKVGLQHAKALSTLFENESFQTIFKYREIYRHLNHTADVADKAMDYLLDILLKM